MAALPVVPPSVVQQSSSSTQNKGCLALYILWVTMEEELILLWICPQLPNWAARLELFTLVVYPPKSVVLERL